MHVRVMPVLMLVPGTYRSCYSKHLGQPKKKNQSGPDKLLIRTRRSFVVNLGIPESPCAMNDHLDFKLTWFNLVRFLGGFGHPLLSCAILVGGSRLCQKMNEHSTLSGVFEGFRAANHHEV